MQRRGHLIWLAARSGVGKLNERPERRTGIVNPSETSPAEPASGSDKRYAIVGGLVGAGLPFCYGAWSIYSVWSQPEPPPGVGFCGMPVVGGLVSIAFDILWAHSWRDTTPCGPLTAVTDWPEPISTTKAAGWWSGSPASRGLEGPVFKRSSGLCLSQIVN
jgi:hypothetical protein